MTTTKSKNQGGGFRAQRRRFRYTIGVSESGLELKHNEVVVLYGNDRRSIAEITGKIFGIRFHDGSTAWVSASELRELKVIRP
jgi:hypothetical protein